MPAAPRARTRGLQLLAHPPVSPIGHNELEPLGLTQDEIAQIIAFLRALSGGVDAPLELLQVP